MLAIGRQHRIEEIDEGKPCAKQTCPMLITAPPDETRVTSPESSDVFLSSVSAGAPHLRPPVRSQGEHRRSGPSYSEMSVLIFTVLSSIIVHRDVEAWGANVKYAVNCPERCNVELCGTTQRCRRTVLDDCGCCQVCAAGRGEHCYRTVSGMHGVKCGPGLFCEFYKDEDDYGDEYGICKDCMYGTYGVECRKTCSCKEGVCDRETGACLTFKFFAKIASKHSAQPQAGGEMGSGEVSNTQSVDQHTDRDTVPRWLNPR